MGMCISEERMQKRESVNVNDAEIPSSLKEICLISSKQLNPKTDHGHLLLAKYFDLYKGEMNEYILKLYIDILGGDDEKLIKLSFSSNNLEVKQIKFLAIALSYCSNLESLELSNCGITSKSLSYLVKGLPHTPCLVKLDLSNNPFECPSLKNLIKVFKFTQILKYLDLSYLKINEFDITSIQKILEVCLSLSWIRLEHLNTSEECLTMLIELSSYYQLKNFYITLNDEQGSLE